MHNMIYVTGGYSREMVNMFLVGQVSGLVKNFTIGFSSDTLNVENVKLCTMLLLIATTYLFAPLSVTYFKDTPMLNSVNQKFYVLTSVGLLSKSNR